MADPKLLAEARAILADITPLAFDCGTLCGHKCCTDFAPDVGVYLLPGEIELYDGSEDWMNWKRHSTKFYDFAPSWDKHRHVWLMQCHKFCSRDGRPFECRTYPLIPYLREDGGVQMRYAPWAYGVCPLADTYPLSALQPAFIAATQRAWTLLMENDPDMLDHVRWITEQINTGELPSAPPVPDTAAPGRD